MTYAEKEALLQMAYRERRGPREQVAHILEMELKRQGFLKEDGTLASPPKVEKDSG
jgi:hypothetical protein